MVTLAQPATLRERLRAVEFRFGNRLAHMCDSLLGFAGCVAVAATIAGATEFVVHEVLTALALPEVVHATADAFLMATATAVIVSLLLFAIRERHRRMLQEVQRVADLNHAVRNALQVIVHSQYLPQDEQDTKAILDSVQRIDMTLRELFPTMPHPMQHPLQKKTDAA